MQNNPYQTRQPNIIGNNRIRTPQREAYDELAKFKSESDGQEREIGIVLPVGCGKSGCITLAPFAFKATRTLVVAPGVPIAGQLHNDFDPTRPDMFYIKCGVLDGTPYPEPAEIRGTETNVTEKILVGKDEVEINLYYAPPAPPSGHSDKTPNKSGGNVPPITPLDRGKRATNHQGFIAAISMKRAG